MFRGIAICVLIATTAMFAGCSVQRDASFSARNTQVDLDLQSFVRAHSNELLNKTVDLLSAAEKGSKSSRKMDRSLDETITLMDQLHMNLPSLLAAQDVEIAELRQQVSDGVIDMATLNARSNDVATYRKALLGSLNSSAVRAASTVQALNGLSGDDLMNLIGPAQDLARDLQTARTMIEMQL